MSLTQDITAAEILYKLGGLEIQVKEGMSQIDKQITHLRSEIHENRSEYKAEIKHLDTRISSLEIFKQGIIARASVVVVGLVVVWSVFGEAVQTTIQRMF